MMLTQLGDEPLAAVIAAVTSLVVTLCTLAMTSAQQKKKNTHDFQLEEFKAELLERRDEDVAQLAKWRTIEIHLGKTLALLPKVKDSFHNLAQLKTANDAELLLRKTTETRKLYSEYQQHLTTPENEYFSYGDDLKATLDRLQGTLTKIVLDLTFSRGERDDPQTVSRIAANLEALNHHTKEASRMLVASIKVYPPPQPRKLPVPTPAATIEA